MARSVPKRRVAPKGYGKRGDLACMEGRKKCPSYAKAAYARAAARTMATLTSRPRTRITGMLKDKATRIRARKAASKRLSGVIESLSGRRRNAQLRALAERLGAETAIRPGPGPMGQMVDAQNDLVESNKLAQARASALMDNLQTFTNAVTTAVKEITRDNGGAPGVPSMLPTPSAAPAGAATPTPQDATYDVFRALTRTGLAVLISETATKDDIDFEFHIILQQPDVQQAYTLLKEELARWSPMVSPEAAARLRIAIQRALEQDAANAHATIVAAIEALEAPASIQMAARETPYAIALLFLAAMLATKAQQQRFGTPGAQVGTNILNAAASARSRGGEAPLRSVPGTPYRVFETAEDATVENAGSPSREAAVESSTGSPISALTRTTERPADLGTLGATAAGAAAAWAFNSSVYIDPLTGKRFAIVMSTQRAPQQFACAILEQRLWRIMGPREALTERERAGVPQRLDFGRGFSGGLFVTTPSAVPNVGFGPGYRGSDPSTSAQVASAMLAKQAPAALKLMEVRTHKQQLDYAEAVDRTHAAMDLLDHTTRGEQNDYYATNKVAGLTAPSFPAYIPNAIVESTQIQSMQMRPDDVDVDALANRAYPYADPVAVKRAMNRNVAFQSGLDAQSIVSFIQLVQNDQTTQPEEKAHIIAVLKRDGIVGARARATSDEVLQRFFQNIYGRGESSYQTTFLGGAFNTTHYDAARGGIVDRNERLKALYYGENPTLFAAPFATRIKQAAAIQAATTPSAGEHEAAQVAARAAEARLQVQLNDRFLTNDVVAAVGLANLTGIAQATTLHEEIAPGVPGGRTSAQQTLQQQAAGIERGTQYSRSALQEVPGYVAEYVALANARRCAMLNNIGAR